MCAKKGREVPSGTESDEHSRIARPRQHLSKSTSHRANTIDAIAAAPSRLEQPIRAEVFGLERLTQHAESLAAAQPAADTRGRGRRLLPRVRENGKVLLAGYRNIVEAVRQKRQITQAEEWLLDNFHVVDAQIREIRDHLPRSFYKLLPKIAEGHHLGGYPRVYGLAWAYVAHTDSRFDLETLRAFVRAYQRVQPLGIGELWAVAIHLRVALLENLRRLSQLIIRARDGRARADEMADRLLGLSGEPAERMEDVLRELGEGPLESAFAVQALLRLRDQAPSMTPALEWLNENLAGQGTSPTDVVAQAHQEQAAANITVRNIITSMRWMSSIGWPDFFESVSLVDETLRRVPEFAAMDFPTRDKYRAAIEELSRGSERSELEVAREAVAMARAARAEREPHDETDPADERSWAPAVSTRREEDPGYYLVSRGRWTFEKRMGYRAPLRVRIRRAWRAHAISGYFGLIALLTALLLFGPLLATWHAGASVSILILIGTLALVPASNVAVALVHRLVTALVPPRLLCKLSLDRGVPAEYRTMVVVPTLLTSHEDIEESIERLEVHYLANPGGHLHFALLTDWKDAPQEHLPGDEELLAALADGVAALNERYEPPPGGGDRFILLHRRRLWNEQEGKWIGWERKRGKLHELNRLLRGATDTSFVPINGTLPTVPAGVRYVITLDADTRLPGRAAYRLVGAMAHPLNRPRFDPAIGRVVDGYGILQPRIVPSLPTGLGSTSYQRIVSGPGGVDPYAGAVSDVYQDLFGEGSFTGKGIYDVDAFEAALAGRVPENALLSHDLFEGVFARAGLVTDIDLFEQFPSNYEVAVRRHHRWVRGDWQLLPWILGHKDVQPGNTQRARIPVQGRWKMLDNLRRSLFAPSSFLLAIAAWTLPATSPLLWTGIILAAIALPALVPVLDGMIPRRQGFSKRSHLRATGQDVQVAMLQAVLAIATLAHQARYLADAVVRTLARLYVTRRHLLEWVPAAQAGYGVDLKLRSFYWHLRWSVVVAVGVGTLVALIKPGAWPAAGPLLLLWGLAPVLAWRLSVPAKAAEQQRLSPKEARTLRRIARRTWRFFETFVRQEEHALPPDNFQEDPEPVVAHRTSPTNIGLYLLSTLVAHDFGWIGIVDMVQRLEATLKTMTTMRRFHGHFFNWYDTRDLRALDPLYVSTVDSGNLAGHLIALAQGCRQLLQQPPLGPQALEGIRDTLGPVLEQRSTLGTRTEMVTAREAREALEAMAAALDDPPTSMAEWGVRLEQLEARAENLLDIVRTIAADAAHEDGQEVLVWTTAVRDTVRSHARDLELLRAEETDSGAATAIALEHRLAAVALQAEQLAQGMDFRFLFDPSRRLFSIGYRVADDTLDPSSYDLLASEARLASFVAIAKGDVSPRHWFLLGRSLTPVGRGAALVSWSGSMFEYLMPLLVMEQPALSLLDLTSHLVVGRQIRYGVERGVPWGVSESAYNQRDVQLTYQYSDFGVPGLGLKRGLFEDVVVAPYATALAAMVDPSAAVANIARLEEAGARGDYGFYEALDYTPSRLPEDERVAVVRAYMAHHQGMTVVALGNVLHHGLTQRRFHAHPMIRASELLLQERTPRAVAVTRPRGEEVEVAVHVRDLVPPTLRRFESPHDIPPRTHLLSNGRYLVMVTAAGSGFSRLRNLAVTRWREDTTRDCWGSFVFLRDAKTGDVWSAGFQPSGTEMDTYNVVYAEDRAKISQRDRSLSITLEVLVSAEDDAELRQLTVTNRENRDREIDVTSYAEIVLAPQAADEAHPAFSNLFVQTEIVPELEALLATRRPRSPDEAQPWLAHVAAIDGESIGEPQYESDRARFLGRGRGIRTPVSVIEGEPLTNTVGTVLDPIVSLRYRVAIPAGGTVRLVFTTLVAPTRDEALDIAEKYRQPETFERESSLAWMYAQVQLHHLGITQDEAHLFQRLANRMLYNDRTLRTTAAEVAGNQRGPSGLWAHGISGDLPIAVVRVERDEERDVARQLLRAHEYWRLKGISSDLVILNAKGTSYAQDLQQAFESMVRASRSAGGGETDGGRGNIFVLREDLLPPQDVALLRSAARLVVLANTGSLSEQAVRVQRSRPGPVPPQLRAPRKEAEPVPPPTLDLVHFNGLGGFSRDGREYVTVLGRGQWTPAPWINVVANPDFGFQVSESGAGYTWSVNSRENKLTPWTNDPVSDTPGEAFYVRDLDSGVVWGPTCLPIREEDSPYVIRHGQGYSRFEHTSHGIALELLQFVPPSDPLKISRLTLVNRSKHRRRLAVTAYAEWVLDVARDRSAPYVVTEIDGETGAAFARNAWNSEFAGRVAFADLGARPTSWTCDRLEFLGRNASLDHPAALERGDELSGATGATLDPCAALQTEIELQPGQRAEVLFLLGQGESAEQARTLISRYRAEDCEALLRRVREHWDVTLGTVQVRTPEASMDLLLNRWLLYQTLSCRLWSRSAFYQSGGAYGFRDQLQDVAALVVARPEIAREHILRAAARQFPEGDVQHWWHPPTGRGVRTRISDDLLWLPYAVAQYLAATEDWSVLDETIPWLQGPTLEEHQHESYFQPEVSEDRSSLFEHCARALDRSLDVGSHGLPLIGTGDWNDGMNRVGQAGHGESVWLGWFLHANLSDFAHIADRRADNERAALWRKRATALLMSLENAAWDGEWYARAFFDDGTPLGSVRSDECQIDSIAQSWAVLSGVGNPDRARQAMDSVVRRLVRPDDGLLLLFTPPFDRTVHDPGYIKGYPPGIRENGGQYTHAAIWSLIAFAQLRQGDKSLELFNLLNPINHASRRASARQYKVEPYVVAADVYAAPTHVGRGGWTWYTGAAGWLYRAGLEWILGFRKRGAALAIDPCIPRKWKRYEIVYRHGDTLYHIAVENPDGVGHGVSRISLDGTVLPEDALVPLSDDGLEHRVQVVLG